MKLGLNLCRLSRSAVLSLTELIQITPIFNLPIELPLTRQRSSQALSCRASFDVVADHCETLAPSVSQWCREEGMWREESPGQWASLGKPLNLSG